MKIKKIVSFVLLLTCMVCLGLSFLVTDVKTAKAQEPTVALLSVDTEYNNYAWGGNTMAVGLIFDKNFTAKAYAGNDGEYDAPVISAVRAYAKINGQSGVIENSFLVTDDSNRIVFLYSSSALTLPEGQEHATFTIDAGAPFGGEYLPEITLYLVDGKWQLTEKPETPEVPTLGTPDVEFVEIHAENNMVWAGSATTRALRLTFS